MKNYIRQILNQDIIKVFSFNATATLIRMVSGFISVKIVAAIIGPAGVAILGQLNNFCSIIQGIAKGGITTGVTKYISEYKTDEEKIKVLISTAFYIIIILSLLLGTILIICHKQVSKIILLDEKYGYAILIFGFTLILYTLDGFLLSIINGYKEFKKYVSINICGTILGLIFSISLVSVLGLTGAIINAVTFQSIMLFVTLWMCRKCPWFKKNYFSKKFDNDSAKNYLKYSLMTLTTLLTFPTSQMLLRGYVISEISIVEAGWWEAMNRISSMYLSVITSSFSIYYLPRLAELKNNIELKSEIVRCYKTIIPILLFVSLIIYSFKKLIIQILFNPDFYPMENLFSWQLTGDFFKISSWLLSYLMLAKAKTVMYITIEILFSLTFVLFSFLFMKWNGTIGITQAYMVNYIIYLITMIFIFRNILFAKKYK